jgi:hypothetical protein
MVAAVALAGVPFPGGFVAADYRISSLSITEIPQGVSGAEGLG